ncbi:hypothetical protein EV121DRAFT_285907 [Schizophyllum commune]
MIRHSVLAPALAADLPRYHLDITLKSFEAHDASQAHQCIPGLPIEVLVDQQPNAITFVNSPMPRKSVNTLPISLNATDTGSSMILAGSPFQAHDA